MAFVKKCLECGIKFNGKTRKQKFCSVGCRTHSRDRISDSSLMSDSSGRSFESLESYGNYRNTGDHGAANELIVCADLLARGFSVYRSTSQSAPVDLVILKGSLLIKVEVSTAKFSGGYISHAKKKADCDLLALVVGKQILYSPPGLVES